MNWTLFLDRDGVINHETFENYITKPEEFKFLEGVTRCNSVLVKYFHKNYCCYKPAGCRKRHNVGKRPYRS